MEKTKTRLQGELEDMSIEVEKVRLLTNNQTINYFEIVKKGTEGNDPFSFTGHLPCQCLGEEAEVFRQGGFRMEAASG